MTSLIDRLTRFEMALCTLLNKANAAIAATIARVVYQCSPLNIENDNTDDSEAVSIAWDDLEQHFGMPKDYLLPDIIAANNASLAALGFFLCQSLNHPEAQSGQDDSCLILSEAFSSILRGTIAPQRWKQRNFFHQPDDQSRAFIALVHEIAVSGGASLLYRQSETQGASRQREITALANALSVEAADFVFVTARIEELTWKPLKLVRCLLSSILYLPEDAIILEPFQGQFAGIVQATESDDGFPAVTASSDLTLAYDADKIVSLLPCLTQTVLITIPMNGILPKNVASAFAGAVGPFRSDRAAAEERISTSITGHRLSSKVSKDIYGTLGDADCAGMLLRTVRQLAGQNSESRNETVTTSFSDEANKLATHLLTSLAPHFATTQTTEHPKQAEFFDPRLLICDPDLTPYLERADRFRDLGVKILIAGPPGTGKTALASDVANRIGMPLRELRGSSIFSKGWGESERLIQRAFREAAVDKVMLFIDEADALLADRARDDTNRALVVTATSQFLKCIDVHPLPMVAATNFLDQIDQAILRRFDLVVQTKPLPHNREALAWRSILKLEPPAGFKPLGATVVADYALTRRRLEFFNENDPAKALAILREVQSARGAAGKPTYGFVRP